MAFADCHPSLAAYPPSLAAYPSCLSYSARLAPWPISLKMPAHWFGELLVFPPVQSGPELAPMQNIFTTGQRAGVLQKCTLTGLPSAGMLARLCILLHMSLGGCHPAGNVPSGCPWLPRGQQDPRTHTRSGAFQDSK